MSDPAFRSEMSIHTMSGLTKRELFAAMAMQGMLSQSSSNGSNGWESLPITASEVAVEFSDALIKALE